MSAATLSADAVVVGAGVVGLACAERLCARRLRVVVVDPAGVAGGATQASGGLVRALELGGGAVLAPEAFSLFRRRGWRGRWPAVCGSGGLTLLRPDQHGEARAASARLRARGLAAELVGPIELAAHQPHLAVHSETVAMYEPHAGWVAATLLARALVADAGPALTLRVDVPVTEVMTEGGAVVGVDTTACLIRSPAVVLAAGVASTELARRVGVAIPLRTRAISYGRFDLGDEPLTRDHAVVDHEVGMWLRPSDGLVLAGAVSDQLDVEPLVRWEIPAAEEERIRHVVARRYPRLATAPLVDGVTAYDAVSPDKQGSVVSWLAPSGLVTATGWNGGGLKLAPMIGHRVASLVAPNRWEGGTDVPTQCHRRDAGPHERNPRVDAGRPSPLDGTEPRRDP